MPSPRRRSGAEAQAATAAGDGFGHHHIGSEHLLLTQTLARRQPGADYSTSIEGSHAPSGWRDVVIPAGDGGAGAGVIWRTSPGIRNARAEDGSTLPQAARRSEPRTREMRHSAVAAPVHPGPDNQTSRFGSTAGPTRGRLRLQLRRLAPHYPIGEACVELPPAIDARARFDLPSCPIRASAARRPLVQQGNAALWFHAHARRSRGRLHAPADPSRPRPAAERTRERSPGRHATAPTRIAGRNGAVWKS